MNVSHETIYKSLFIQAKGILKKELTRHLRSKIVMRQRKQDNVKKFISSKIADAITISKRLAEIEYRAIPSLERRLYFLVRKSSHCNS